MSVSSALMIWILIMMVIVCLGRIHRLNRKVDRLRVEKTDLDNECKDFVKETAKLWRLCVELHAKADYLAQLVVKHGE